jgi:DNA-binding transcriptional ArsR family regulator
MTTISPEHLQMLARSGISAEYAAYRGFETVDNLDRLATLNIPVNQRRVPGLLIPAHDKLGNVIGCQYRPDKPAEGKPKYTSPLRQRNYVDVPMGFGHLLDNPAVPLFITEGAKKADCAALHGIMCVSINGVWGWRGSNAQFGKTALADWSDIALNGRRVVLAFDGDVARKETVHRAMRELAAYLKTKGAQVEYLHLPDTDEKTGLDDYLTAHTTDELWALVSADVPVKTEEPQQQMLAAPIIPTPADDAERPEPVTAEAVTRQECHAVFHRWLGKDFDTYALDAVLATLAVERFDDGSDPVWLLVISGPGNAKTEVIQATTGAGAIMASSISGEAAFLSATPQKDRAKNATGGLLMDIGARGSLALKDVTSLLSMNTDVRQKVLAALREIYDGRWTRMVGADGGRKIEWRGRIAVVGAVTTAWDQHHAVISAMGDRFLLVRTDSADADIRRRSGKQAMQNTGLEPEQRADLARAIGGVLLGADLAPADVSDADEDLLLAAADLVTRARTAVEYDYAGNVIDSHAPEMPTRFAKQLKQVVRGGRAIGMTTAEAMALAIRCARNSMPPLRLAILEDLEQHPYSTPAEVRRRINKPWSSVKRQLESLYMLGAVVCDEIQNVGGNGTRWYYSLPADTSLEVLRCCSPASGGGSPASGDSSGGACGGGQIFTSKVTPLNQSPDKSPAHRQFHRHENESPPACGDSSPALCGDAVEPNRACSDLSGEDSQPPEPPAPPADQPTAAPKLICWSCYSPVEVAGDTCPKCTTDHQTWRGDSND